MKNKLIPLAAAIILLVSLCKNGHCQQAGGPFQADENTLLLLHFDEGKGDPQDASGKKHSVINYGTKYSPTGKLGSAISFDGSADANIALEDTDDLSFTDGQGNDKPFTIEFWLKPDQLAHEALLEKVCYSPLGIEFATSLYSGGYNFSLYSNDLKDYISIAHYGESAKGLIPTNQWTHLAFTYDGSKSEQGLNVFINGVADKGAKREAKGKYTGMKNTRTELEIGTYNGGKAAPLHGMIDELRISNIVRYKNDFQMKK